LVTCLPSPAASAIVLEGEEGVLAGITPGTVWAEMSTTDEAEVLRLGAKIIAAGGEAVDCPVSGGCHRAATGNIAIFTCQASGLDLATAYEAIRISSGNSFVHETESQVILNGSRDINFTMDLVLKDIGLFQQMADRAEVPLEINPLLIKIMQDGAKRYGEREWSPNIIRRLEDACDVNVLADGFPAEIVDEEPEEPGYEVEARRQIATFL